ncbi:hypothetical protein [Sphingomonas sp. 3-13AW]|uniref:hypothetical protein n=1 Tax=Sphingomonas sp. 3-13AW TaxID=3050450 RepID=UPI003BB638DD
MKETVNVVEVVRCPRLPDDCHVYSWEEPKPSTAPFELPDQITRERCCAFLIGYYLIF